MRFITETTPGESPQVSIASNLAGTHTFATIIDASAREAAAGILRFGDNVASALPVIATADLASTVTTFQGPILLADYLVTRCVEAVVHGRDLVDPVASDPAAFMITADALMSVFAHDHPNLRAQVTDLPTAVWIDAATGRLPAPPGLETALPVMT